jgi:hypothetical protein
MLEYLHPAHSEQFLKGNIVDPKSFPYSVANIYNIKRRKPNINWENYSVFPTMF